MVNAIEKRMLWGKYLLVLLLVVSFWMVSVENTSAKVENGGTLSLNKSIYSNGNTFGYRVSYDTAVPYPGYIDSGNVRLSSNRGDKRTSQNFNMIFSPIYSSTNLAADLRAGTYSLSNDIDLILSQTSIRAQEDSYSFSTNYTIPTKGTASIRYNYYINNISASYGINGTATYKLFKIDNVWFSSNNNAVKVNWSLPEAVPKTIEYNIVNETNSTSSGWLNGDNCVGADGIYYYRDASANQNGVTYKYHIEYRMPIYTATASSYTGITQTANYSTVYGSTANGSVSSGASANAFKVIKGVPFVELMYGQTGSGTFESNNNRIIVITENDEYSIIEGVINTPLTTSSYHLGYYVLNTGITKILFKVLDPPSLNDVATVTFE